MKVDIKSMSDVELRQLSANLMREITDISNQLDANKINPTRSDDWVVKAGMALRHKRASMYEISIELNARKAGYFAEKKARYENKDRFSKAFVKIARAILPKEQYDAITLKTNEVLGV